MALAMAGKRLWWAVALLVAVLLLYAWIDGGQRPLQEIRVPVDVPGDEA